MENDVITKKERREMRRTERRETLANSEKFASYKKAGSWAFAFVLLVTGIYGFTRLAVNSDGGIGQTASIVLSVNENDRQKGAENAKVTIVEYSDFQCPACASYYPVVQNIIQEFPNDVRVVYRHFPLNQHKQAKLAAYAAEAAGKQGKFWEMHDMIFDNQRTWAEQGGAEEIIYGFAKQLDLNMEQFKTDIKSGEIAKKVDKDYASGVSAGVDSTPTFYVNGKKIKNPRGPDEFRTIIQDNLSDNK